MMDRIFMDLLPTLRKEDWVLAIKLNENINLFKEYPKTAFKDNSDTWNSRQNQTIH